MSSLLLITFIVLDKPISSTKDKRATGMAGVALTNFTRREVENSIQIWGSDVHEDCPKLGPGAMAGLTKLQHLWLAEVCLYEHDTEEGQGLLSQMHYLTNLTRLDLHDSFYVEEEGVPAVAAFSALTASSKLEYLSLRECTLPAAVWECIFPAGRQLPHLNELGISWVKQLDGSWAPAPHGDRLAACCPSLDGLFTDCLSYTPELLAPLQKLSGLQVWTLSSPSSGEELTAVGLLTGLQDLDMEAVNPAEELLLQLPRLQQLTSLILRTPESLCFHKSASEHAEREPVWRQVWQHLLTHSNPEVAQRAVAALAE